jgi:hypothetical protein
MSSFSKWIRVTKSNPCSVCEHPDWCCIGERWVNCMRVQSRKPCVNGGWLHPVNSQTRPLEYLKQQPPQPSIDAMAMMKDFSSKTWPNMQEAFAKSLGVSVASLVAVGCAWAVGYGAWAFPMWDSRDNMIGIRLRSTNGKKWSITGSRQGIFIPMSATQETVWLVEGPTDVAAGLTLGLFCLGRPSCLGGNELISEIIKGLGCRRAIVVSDNDGPGVNGALKLSKELPILNCIFVPPAKDIRQFVNLGGTRAIVDSIVNGMVWQKPEK